MASLLENILGVSIPKDERLQKADWSRRPLSPEALDYAAGDVIYLPRLMQDLHKQLATLGRESWVAEECERISKVSYIEKDKDLAFLSVKGTRELDGKGLAILKLLYDFRESQAIKLNRPPGFVLSAEVLAFISANPDVELDEVPGLGHAGVRRFGKQIREAVSLSLIHI